MVTYINKNTRAKYAGDVLDNAPKNVQNGSVYFAMAEGKYYMYDAENDIWHEQMDNGSGGGGEGGTTDHSKLTNRDKPNQHPIGAITGLQDALDEKQPKGDYALKSEVPETAVLFTKMEPPLTPEQQEQARDNIGVTEGGGSPAYPISEESASTLELTPNVYHKWPEMATLSITLGAETPGVVNEFCGEFVSGSAPTNFSVPGDIKWVNELKIETSKTYQFSIVDGIGVIAGA